MGVSLIQLRKIEDELQEDELRIGWAFGVAFDATSNAQSAPLDRRASRARVARGDLELHFLVRLLIAIIVINHSQHPQRLLVAKMSAIKSTMHRHFTARAKRDARLRNAINLYHLTPLFYPTSAPASSSSAAASSSSAQSLDDSIDHTIREDLYFPEKINGRSSSSSEILSSPPQFLDWGKVLGRRAEATSQGPKDGQATMRDHHNDGTAFGSIAAHYIGQGLRMDGGEVSRATSFSPSSPPSVSARLEFLARTSRSSRPPAVQPRDNVDGKGPQRDNLQVGSSHVVSFLQLDERSSQIRDAFFGTVGGGTKVGLEVVRERTGKWEGQQQQQ